MFNKEGLLGFSEEKKKKRLAGKQGLKLKEEGLFFSTGEDQI